MLPLRRNLLRIILVIKDKTPFRGSNGQNRVRLGPLCESGPLLLSLSLIVDIEFLDLRFSEDIPERDKLELFLAG